MMKKAVCQQRYRLKKKYFNPYPLHLVTKTSPIKCMTDIQWNNLVEYWKDPKKMVCSMLKVNIFMPLYYMLNLVVYLTCVLYMV